MTRPALNRLNKSYKFGYEKKLNHVWEINKKWVRIVQPSTG